MSRRLIPKSWRRFSRRQRGKDQVLEKRLFNSRALTAGLLVLAAILTLLGRMVYLQVFAHQELTTLSDSNRVRLEPLVPTRGLIFDRNGVKLAVNLATYQLEITPELTTGVEQTLTELRRLLPIVDADIERFRKLRRLKPPYSPVALKSPLSEPEVNRLAVELHRFPGVTISAALSRHYPFAEAAAHVIGYVGRIDEKDLQIIDISQYRGASHIGKIGIEKSYESLLYGEAGYQRVETNAQGRVLRVLERQSPVAGQNLYLSLDIRLQQVAEQALGDYNGAVVAIDPRNGEVLALVSQPSFDPNLFVNGIDVKTYRALADSPDRPLYNRALRGVYPPGSTLKPFVGLAGLELGQVNPRHSLYCPGFYRLPGRSRPYRDWKRGGHGRTNLDRAIYQSCDVYFYDLARQLGIDRIHDYLAQFGFGAATGIDLLGEKPGLLPSQNWKRERHDEAWYLGDTIVVGIGQGFMLTTPLQLAHATATLALQGQGFKPQLLLATQRGYRAREPVAPQPLAPMPVVDSVNWRYVHDGMVNVVHGAAGTARRIGFGIDYDIAGKTGTAQVFSLAKDQEYNADELDRRLHDHALFVAFAPADGATDDSQLPDIAVAVVVENGGSGSRTAAPIARQILDAHFSARSTSPLQTSLNNAR